MTTVQSPTRALTAVKAPSLRGERLWLPVGIVATALIAIVGWMLLVSPLRSETSDIKAQTATTTTQVDALRKQIATLQAQQADLPTFQAELGAAQAALPNTSGMPQLLRTLQDLGTASGTSVTAVAATAPAAGTAGGSDAGAAPVTTPVGIVYRIPVTITAKGAYDGLTVFLTKLQQEQPRALLVTGISETADTTGTTLTVTSVAFMAPTAGGK